MVIKTKFKLNPKQEIGFEEGKISIKMKNTDDKIKEIEIIIKNGKGI